MGKIIEKWFFVWLLLLPLIDCGVKIDISRVKEPDPTTMSANDAPSTTSTPSTSTLSTSVSSTTTSTVLNATRATNSTVSSIATTATPLSTTTTATSNISEIVNSQNQTTSSMNVTTSFELTEFTMRSMMRKLTPYNYYCPCDFKINYCDINCCCDVDCSVKDIKQTLECKKPERSIHDYVEEQSIKPCSAETGFSLFCIVEGYKMHKVYRQRNQMFSRLNERRITQFKWPNRFERIDDIDDYREHYKFDDPILVFNTETDKIEILDLPHAYASSHCNFVIPLKHLNVVDRQCAQSIEDHEMFIAEFEEKLRSNRILMRRKPISSSSAILSEFCRRPNNSNETTNCIDATIFHCNEKISASTCKNRLNETDDEFVDLIADHLSIRIHHNFTNIFNFSVHFVYNKIVEPSIVLQRIQVDFFEVNETESSRSAHTISGSIGYALHRPVLHTKLVRPIDNGQLHNDASSTPTNKILEFFDSNRNCSGNEHSMKIPKIESNGDCLLTNTTYNTVNFGENIRLACNAVLTSPTTNETASNIDSTTNYTNLCRAFQREIFQYLFYDIQLENVNATIYDKLNDFISEYGNPRNRTVDWIEMRIANPIDLEQIIAENERDGAFLCRNMILNVRYEFFHGTAIVNDVEHQSLIKSAQIEFGTRLDLDFKVDDRQLKVPIYVDVMFYDFIKLGSSSSASNGHIPSLVAIVLVITLHWLRSNQH